MDGDEGTPQRYLQAQHEFAAAVIALTRQSRYARYHPACDLTIVVRIREGDVLPTLDLEPKTKVAA